MTEIQREQKLTEIIENGTRIKGKVIFIARKKGYGFVGTEEIPFTRIFFHWSELHPVKAKHFTTLKIRDEVEFEVEETENSGLKAIKITTPGSSPTGNSDDVQGKV